MSRQPSSSAALPIAHVVLRILIVLNWLMAAGILALVFVIAQRAIHHVLSRAFSFA